MPKEEAKGWKRGKIVFTLLILLILCSLLAGIAAASADVAYIVTGNPDPTFLSIMDELGRSVEIIPSKKVNNYDFSEFKLLLLNNDIFNNWYDIPVNDYPAVIVNGHNIDEWGWATHTDYNLKSTFFNISINTSHELTEGFPKQIQAYNKTQRGFYRLDKYAVYKGLEFISYMNDRAGDKDAIVALAREGTILTRGLSKTPINANSCFFGITEAKYWTYEARELFKRCVLFAAMKCVEDSDCQGEEIGGRYCTGDDVYQDVRQFYCENPGTSRSECVDDVVSELVKECTDECVDGECADIECHNDGDCDDSNSYTKDTCINPGTENSYCQNSPLECLFDSDCGADGYVGEEYCQDDDVYQDYQDFSCIDNECSDSISSVLIEGCLDICREGGCVERECVVDEDCEDDYYSDDYCQDDLVYRDLHDFSCADETCAEAVISELVDACEQDELCFEGECKNVECNSNSDCGVNGFTGEKYCTEFGVYSAHDFISYTCYNPRTINSYCSDYTLPILIKYCEGSCVSGECVACFSDLSCGINSYIGEPYCIGDEVHQEYQSFDCINPAIPESECSSLITEELIEECADICVNGICEEIECYDDGDCDDSDLYTIDECNNPGTADSYCSHTPINCINDNDCGITGFIGDEFCFAEDIYKNYQNSTCINSETTDSYCDISIGSIFLIDCGEDYCGNWGYECRGDDVWRERNCYERGCSELNGDGCFENSFIEEESVAYCDYGCVDGECIDECEIDEDCDDGLSCNGEEECVQGVCIGGEDASSECDESCGAECDEDSDCACEDDYCDDTTLADYPEYSSCGTSGAEGCLCQDCVAVMIPDSPQCGYVEPYCGDGIIKIGYEECDDGNNDNGDGCDENCMIEYECTEDSDCPDDYYSDNYCQKDNAYKDLIDYFCQNNKCVSDIIPELAKDCGESYCEDWEYYCKCKNIWKTRTCHEKGCEDGSCFDNSYEEKELAEECDSFCWKGECAGRECNQDDWDCDVLDWDFNWTGRECNQDDWDCDVLDWDFNWEDKDCDWSD